MSGRCCDRCGKRVDVLRAVRTPFALTVRIICFPSCRTSTPLAPTVAVPLRPALFDQDNPTT